MRIKLRSFEGVRLPLPLPWYVAPAFQGKYMDARGIVQKEDRIFYQLENTPINMRLFTELNQYLTGRMRMKFESYLLDTVYIPFEHVDANKLNNKQMLFLLKNKKEDV